MRKIILVLTFILMSVSITVSAQQTDAAKDSADLQVRLNETLELNFYAFFSH